MSSMFVRRLSLVLALVLLMGLTVIPTQAQCSQNTFNGDDDFSCVPPGGDDTLDVGTGSDTVYVGVDDANADIVALGGTNGSIISHGGTLTLIVFGNDLYGTPEHAVLMTDDGTIVAQGLISSQSMGLWLQGDGDITYGTGSDSLMADDIGMWVQGSGSATNYGYVYGGEAGVVVGDFDDLQDPEDLFNLFEPTDGVGTINNYGHVAGQGVGLGLYGTGEVNNQGYAEGGLAGVFVSGDDVVVNNGSESNTDAVVGGALAGVLGYGSGTVNNYGTVGSGGVGVVFISRVEFDEELLEEMLETPPVDEFEFILNIGDFINSIEFQGEVTINNDGDIHAPVGVLLLGNGTVNNTGEIHSGLLGVGLYGNGDINNGGLIEGSFVGAAIIGEVEIDTEFLAELFEEGIDPGCLCSPLEFLYVAAAALNAIDFAGGGTITNNALIENVAVGAIELGNGDIINNGGIYAEYVGTALFGNGNLVNNGGILTGGVGMLFIGELSVDDEFFFDIENMAPLLAEGDLFGPISFGAGTVTNNTYIDAGLAGIAALGNVTVTNNGYIGAGLAGIAAAGPNVTVNNDGMIETGGVGIIAAGDNVEVNNSGYVGGEYVGIMALGDATINVEDGYVYGGSAGIVGLGGDQTVNVDGVVVGGGMMPVSLNVEVIASIQDVERTAIALEDGQDRVNLHDDADVHGDILMGDGDDTVQIGSGAHVEGTIDGGSEDNADVLIVGDENMCGEDPDTNERIDGVRNLVENINPEDDTFNFDGENYSVYEFEEGRSGVRSHRCYQFIEDGRINAYDMGATVAGYCNVEEGLNVWAIDEEGNGQVEFSVSAAQMRTALEQAVNGGANVQIAAGARGTSLWALSSNQYQMMRNDGYVYIFEPGRCGPGGEIVVS